MDRPQRTTMFISSSALTRPPISHIKNRRFLTYFEFVHRVAILLWTSTVGITMTRHWLTEKGASWMTKQILSRLNESTLHYINNRLCLG
ncbi:hypothetical protein BDV59DRAFT_188974 [Aspergillus ambiguus]|uniref:uncharacterized protein n=1 Tax=Aspergillus ambiguus TaxID=176160 RepID=UPI003CCCB775